MLKVCKRSMACAGFALSALMTSGCMPFSVDEGELGLITKYGEIVSQETAGLHWRSWLEDDITFSTREQRADIGSFRADGDVSTGVSAYTKDTQTVVVALSITYKLTDPIDVYKRFRTTDNMVSQLLEPRSRQAIEIVFSGYSAQQALEHRPKLTNDIIAQIRESVKGYPIEIITVNSVIQFDEAYEARVAESVQKNVAIQSAERELTIQQKQAEIARVKAQAQADAQVIQAKAEAEALVLRGNAEAEAIRVKSSALEKNPTLAQLVAAEKWNGVLPTTMTPGSTVPFINIRPKE